MRQPSPGWPPSASRDDVLVQSVRAHLAFAGVRTKTCPYCASPNFVERPPPRTSPTRRSASPSPGTRHVGARPLRALARPPAPCSPIPRSAGHASRTCAACTCRRTCTRAVARTEYTAQIGEHYTETETYTKTDSQGNKKTETRTVTRTEYRQLAGQAHRLRHRRHRQRARPALATPSSRASSRSTCGSCADTRPALVSGWIQEEYSRDAEECTRDERGEAIDEVGGALRASCPATATADLAWPTRVEWESLDPMLVPVWVFAVRYRDRQPALRVVINGQTGRSPARSRSRGGRSRSRSRRAIA